MRRNVSAEDFVVAWVTADTVRDVAIATGLTVAAVYSRSNSMRKHGVDLPQFKRPGRNLYTGKRVTELNALIRKYTKRGYQK